MNEAILIWAVCTTFVVMIQWLTIGMQRTTIEIQRSTIEMLELEIESSDREIEALTAKRFVPKNRVFGNY